MTRGRPTCSFPRHLALLLLALVALSGPRPAQAISREEIFARAAPATVLVVAVTGDRESLTTGVLLTEDGLLVTSHKALGGSKDLYIFPPDPRVRDEEFVKYIGAHLERGLRARLAYSDAQADLALLALPPRGAAYPAVPLGDADTLRLRQEVVALGNPTGLAYSQVAGSIVTLRKGAPFQAELALSPASPINIGAPVLDPDGLLVGTVSALRKEAKGGRVLATVRPAGAIRQFVLLGGGRGVALVKPKTAPAAPAAPAPAAAQAPGKGGAPVQVQVQDSGAGPEVLLHELGLVFDKRVGRFHATRIYCELLAARAKQGRAAVFGVGEVEPINITLSEAGKKIGADGVARLLAAYFPALLIDNRSDLWHREGRRYALDFPAMSWAVDDETGAMYATNVGRDLMVYDKGSFRPTGIKGVRDVQVSKNVIYYLGMDNALMSVPAAGQRRQPTRLLPRAVAADQILATQGILYVVEAGQLYRYGRGQWDRNGDPIHRGVRSVAAVGPTWYALDSGGHVFSGGDGKVLEDKGTFDRIWLIGKNVLGLTRSGQVLGYSAASKSWQLLRK
jgi:S1-C subfamily serine protease